MDDVEKWKAKVAKAAQIEEFEATGMGRTIIGWLNAEIIRLTDLLVNDDEMDTNEAKRSAVRGELKAYRLIGEKMNLTKLSGKQASNTLIANGITEEAVTDERSPEEIAQDAGL